MQDLPQGVHIAKQLMKLPQTKQLIRTQYEAFGAPEGWDLGQCPVCPVNNNN